MVDYCSERFKQSNSHETEVRGITVNKEDKFVIFRWPSIKHKKSKIIKTLLLKITK